MIEQITLLLATPIAKAVLGKFYEGIGSELSKKAVETLPEKVQQLGKLIWEKCLRGKPGMDQLLQSAAAGSAADQQRLAEYLHTVLDKDASLKAEAQKLAEEIHVNIHNDFSSQIQHNYGGTHYQIKLGATNSAQGHYSEAEPFHFNALNIRCSQLSAEHHTALRLNNLGASYVERDHFEEAIPLLQESLAIRERILGDSHTDTQGTRWWLEQAQSRASGRIVGSSDDAESAGTDSGRADGLN
ncbi:MAG: tetratricopeptide repeat protein [Pegethrix bostrychoides GSE-TBD4-15B]|jgi:tetratricopeptide (TPR) repeat protein|uniref:Tetratricopeptide repeat protein n=1 Tax=Pegethrix bostrychoides GSE-TBD4-15B TaxID=2839662 RepID=A0A951PG86_9CYAN|nr:tetratricopeptide repeat protein [Pegethrix bostrychoides GSE-TBD4-15B]